ncbi:V-type ATPase subunit [Streptococcus panodentis]|uniref:V-type ATP synthase subunit C n=1 Tax=Streptococcus panodentis TaxID=1581472 RepID=A0ABS5AWS3_9STRE|nr:V-type ATPase subunit [Streptococcus panodentis]MBP2621017.1 V-type ATP synthase subunit C [Streptococcus panodentis]
MDGKTYSQVNTAISVREASFLTPQQYEELLQTADAASRSQLLQGTVYALDTDALSNLNAIEQVLMGQLMAEYAWAFDISPDAQLPSLFTLRYTYHNLKVLLKQKATDLSLEHLLLPAGPYSLEILEHLTAAFSAEHCPDWMLEEVLATWQEYEDYQDLRVLEIGMDLAYFKHLKRLGRSLDNAALKTWVDVSIDCYNAVTAKRAVDLHKPHSFMKQLLSDEGSLTAAEWIALAERGDFLSWFSQVNPLDYDVDLRLYEEKMRTQSLTAVELEYLADLLQVKLLAAAQFETDGPLPLARYLLGRELEVKNLRLILTGLDNQLPLSAIKERMRPIYGQD